MFSWQVWTLHSSGAGLTFTQVASAKSGRSEGFKVLPNKPDNDVESLPPEVFWMICSVQNLAAAYCIRNHTRSRTGGRCHVSNDNFRDIETQT